MTEKKFSRFKAASFIGALLLVFTSFVVIGFGINQIAYDSAFFGIFTTISGLVCMAAAILVYRNYQQKYDEMLKEQFNNKK